MSAQIAERRADHRTGDFTSAVNSAMVAVGERFGLYDAIADIGFATPTAITERTGISGEKVSRWLRDQAAAGYLYVDDEGRFSVSCPLPARVN